MPCEKSFWTQKNLLRQNCSHPPANAFLIDFGVILRSKIPILRVKARRKMQKCIVVGQFGSIPVRLPTTPPVICVYYTSKTSKSQPLKGRLEGGTSVAAICSVQKICCIPLGTGIYCYHTMRSVTDTMYYDFDFLSARRNYEDRKEYSDRVYFEYRVFHI